MDRTHLHRTVTTQQQSGKVRQQEATGATTTANDDDRGRFLFAIPFFFFVNYSRLAPGCQYENVLDRFFFGTMLCTHRIRI